MKTLLLGMTGLGILAGMAFAQMPQMPAPTVGKGRVTKAENVEKRRYTGTVDSPQRVALVPRVAAELEEVGFLEGDIVTNRQVLYRLDDTRYAAAVKAIEAQIVSTKARLAYAEKNYERLSTLYKKNVSSMDEMDSALADRDAFQATIRQLEANLVTAKDDLTYTEIVSPITGKIGFNNFTVGNYLTPSSGTLATIVQLDPIRIRFSISNRDYLELFGTEANLKKDAVVKLVLADNKPYPEEGRIVFVDNRANRSTDTIQVYAEIANREYRLLPETTVTVNLQKKLSESCTAVVPSAVLYDAQGAYVWVLDGENKAEQRRVKLGNATENLQYILSGLKEGETVVTEGTHKVMPGIAVQAVPAK